ncbi:MAG: sulfotransferase [Caulobacteraceae bacterium]|nr:sulfotransferase [Caulobacteraceae bacterium]
MPAARQAVDRALALNPREAFVLDTLGVTLTRTGDFHRAVPLFEKATVLAPRAISPLFNLAFGRQYIGDLEGAERAYRRVIELDPGHERAYLALVEMGRQTPKRNFIPALEKLFAKAGGDPGHGPVIAHALARSQEDLGNYESALYWLERAHAHRRQTRPYDPSEDLALFDAAMASAPGASVAGAPEDAPIFIIGMPRSGTTLADRILTSHPEVGSVGEFQAIPHMLKQAAGARTQRLPDAQALRNLGPTDLERLGPAYLAAAQATGPDRPRLVDKLPFNFFYAGVIHRALPNARILCMRRDAMDTCLSNFRQSFAEDSAFHDYAYDLADIARYHVLFDQLISHWRDVLPADRFMELRYEELVDQQETQTRRMLDFCGLSWDPRCLMFQENEAGVSTASASQVRQPLFTSSIDRWRRYGDGMAAIAAILGAAGLA